MKVELKDEDIEFLYNLLSDIVYSNFHFTITFESNKCKEQIVEIKNLMSYYKLNLHESGKK